MGELRNFFNQNRIYLPEDLCESITAFYVMSFDANLNLFLNDLQNSKQVNEDFQKEYKDSLLNASNTLKHSISPLLKRIEKEFRLLLGNH